MNYFNLNQKINFARSFIFKNSPLYVQFYITPRCNLACEQCNIIYADAKHHEMSIDQIKMVAKNLKKIGVNIVLLIGGEPFVRKDIDKIVEAFVDQSIHVRMQTNGIASPDMLRKCVSAGGKDISISLDTLQPELQDEINGGFNNSWNRAIKTISNVSKIFPENATAFFNSVIMPKNLKSIKQVIKFATKIGWGVSLVPVHVSNVNKPQAYRTLDFENNVTFDKDSEFEIKNLTLELKKLKKKYNLYDSVEYIEDIENFLLKKPLKWRSKNKNICDSPNLYFAISPSGTLKSCCDFEIEKNYYVFENDFPEKFRSGEIHEYVYQVTNKCDGCMYGSYPEITLTARSLGPFVERLKYFNLSPPKIKKLEPQELQEIALEIINEQN